MIKRKWGYFYLLVFNILMIFNNNSYYFMENGSSYGFCDNLGVLKSISIVGKIFSFCKIIIPVILIIKSIKILYKEVLSEKMESSIDISRKIINKVILGISIFFIPTLVGIFLNNLNGYDDTKNAFTKCGTCLFSNCDSLISDAFVNEKEKEDAILQEKENLKKQNDINNQNAINNVINNSTKDDTTSSKSNSNNVNNSNINSNTKSKNNSSNTSSTSVKDNYNGGVSYGKGCTGFVSSSSYNSAKVNNMFKKAEKYIGTPYSKLDCSSFVKKAYGLSGGTAAGEANNLKNKCVSINDVKPGDVFFISYYNTSGKCTGCVGSTWGNRCSRWNCIMHVGIVKEVKNGKVTKVLHSSSGGVKYKSNLSYLYSPASGGSTSSGKGWYIMFVRPYA